MATVSRWTTPTIPTLGEIELTDDDRRNGWTVETLQMYLQEREQAASLKIAPERPKRIMRIEHEYDPHKW